MSLSFSGIFGHAVEHDRKHGGKKDGRLNEPAIVGAEWVSTVGVCAVLTRRALYGPENRSCVGKPENVLWPSGRLCSGMSGYVAAAGFAVGHWANCRSRSASSWLPKLSWIHPRSLYASGSWCGNSLMCWSMSASAFSHSATVFQKNYFRVHRSPV